MVLLVSVLLALKLARSSKLSRKQVAGLLYELVGGGGHVVASAVHHGRKSLNIICTAIARQTTEISYQRCGVNSCVRRWEPDRDATKAAASCPPVTTNQGSPIRFYSTKLSLALSGSE